MNTPPVNQSIGETLTYKVDDEFRNRSWAERFGKFQSNIRSWGENGGKKVRIDFSDCRWADPLPLLSLIIACAEQQKNETKITVILPAFGKNSNQDNLLCFLSSEGFISQLQSVGVTVKKNSEDLGTDILTIDDLPDVDFNDLAQYNSLAGRLYYREPTLITAKVLDIAQSIDTHSPEYPEGSIDNWVSEWLESFSHRLQPQVPKWSFSDLRNRLYICLNEMLSNVYEHAYPENETKYAGIYIRFRQGLTNESLQSAEKRDLKTKLRSEQKEWPTLKFDYLEINEGCVEVFVIDAGVGMSYNMQDHLDLTIKENRDYPFRGSYRAVFEDGKRGKRHRSKTVFGGLHLLGQLMRGDKHGNRDFLIGRDANEWIGNYLPINTNANDSYLLISSNPQVAGLGWIARFGWRAAADNKPENWQSWYDVPENRIGVEHPLSKELKETATIRDKFFAGKQINLFVSDRRFDFDRIFNLKKKDQGQKKRTFPKKYFELSNDDQRYCLFLPRVGMLKNQIKREIESLSVAFNESNDRSLIVADIPINEASVYHAALSGASFIDESFKKFSSIILVTRRLSVCVLTRKGNTYSHAPSETRNYLINRKVDEFEPHKTLMHLIAWLRNHDSTIFWENVLHQNENSQFFVNGDIAWSKQVTLQGYLNFAQTLTDAVSLTLYRIAIERSLSLHPSKGCNYIATDLISERIAKDANQIFYNESTPEAGQINLGSVYVTGLSTREATMLQEGATKSQNIYFFRHLSIKGDGGELQEQVAHLFLWPAQNKDWLDKNFPNKVYDYRRVGKSHVIAKNGWKFYPLPRFNTLTEDGQSVYGRSPREAYNDWQGASAQPLINIGHYHYEDKHDLFKVDFRYAIDESFKYGGELATFLVAQVIFSLGGTKDDLIDADKAFTERVSKQIEQLTSTHGGQNQHVAVMVYPAHFNTSYIIDILKRILSPSLVNRIVALIPVSKDRQGSSFLISPLVFEAITQKIDAYREGQREKSANALLFDGTVVDGRTRKELKHLLFHLGADEVKTLCLLDRQRLPFNTPKINRHKAYWRLDVPRLGNGQSCPLCKALAIAEGLKNDLASELARHRIEQWAHVWGSMASDDHIAYHGLKSTPIDPISKKFGIYFNEETNEIRQVGGEQEKIVISSSTGLAIYASEIHSMTSRDDFALSMCRKSKLPPAVEIEMLCSNILLFGNEFSRSCHLAMLRRIFDAANNIEEVDNHTALAALTLILQNPSYIKSIFQSLKEPGQRDISVTNLDMRLVLACFGRGAIDEMRNSRFIARLLKTEPNPKQIYRDFHYEIYNDHGELHDRPIKKLTSGIYPIETLLDDASLSLSKIDYLINHINEWEFRSRSEDSWQRLIQAQELITKVIANISELIDEFSLKKHPTSTISQKGKELKETIIKQVNDKLTKMLVGINSELFFEIDPSSKDFQIRGEIDRVFRSITLNDWQQEIKAIDGPASLELGFSKFLNNYPDKEEIGLKSKWINWDSYVVDEFKYLLTNVRHAKGRKVEDPWGKSEDTKDGWIHVEYLEHGVSIKCANYSPQNAAKVKSLVDMKVRPERVHLVSLGGILSYEDEPIASAYIISAVLYLPYV